MDAPESVSQEGMTEFLSGIDYGMQQTRREQLLDVSIADVKKAAEEWLIESEGRSTAVLGEKGEWVQEPEWSIKDLGMQKKVEGSGEEAAEKVAAVPAA